ncbi:D-alanyl-D-alanine carboxypeptidase/D-alanyl-D-alanine endopeptidase [Nocardiopsis ansamitocini]|uniref:D-alanyl-D-alanine carboxypeptidase DacC n=1 Tax=Nocardiopsis ansamitocini TaxID=1670832 RepID=A0A9W6P3B3_9ACTN|nr:D-alanyl-D-alanine carboxypeptidase/D-alanyl-D-alanine-endopeptidase [Nocardiopsis ansamitocini]GLU46499.1 D-alanyl-D-alanine carboxypeptidase DacC [Nocardiopsis ansamitocini]
MSAILGTHGPLLVRTGGTALVGVLTAGLLAVGAAPATAADGLSDLRTDLDALLKDPLLAGATSGVVVRNAATGEVLYEHQPQTSLLPASNNKLLTSAAALEVLGADYRFSTLVSATAAPSDGVIEGDMHLIGTGDPSLTAETFDALAAKVADAGVTEVTGDLIADDTWFDDARLGAGWEAGDQPYYYAAQVSALTVAANSDLDTGVVEVQVSPGTRGGRAVGVALRPATDYVRVDNTATTGGRGKLAVTRRLGGNTIAVSGGLPLGGRAVTELRTVHEPTGYALDVFRRALADNGVRVGGSPVSGTAPADLIGLVHHESAELGELLVPFMKLSNNTHAEILVKTIGRRAGGEGSWAAGLPEVERALTRIGLDTPGLGLELTDGSGLSRGNRLSAALLADLLQEATDEPWFETWTDSFPIAGDPDRMVGGTLTNRMRGTPAAGNVRAKTGTMTGVSALSGYVTGKRGEPLLFVVLDNGHTGAAPRPVQDAIAVRLARFARDAPTVGDASRTIRQIHPGQQPNDRLECSWARAC